jgi:6-phosphogluconolactonase (cycloisomerase 2 family)
MAKRRKRKRAENRTLAAALLIWSACAVALGGCHPGAAMAPGSRVPDSNRAGYVYISINGEGTISEFARSADGSLRFLRRAGAGAANGPTGIAIDPSGRFLFAANEADGRIHAFRIRRDTGKLVPVDSRESAGQSTERPQQIAIAPSGDFLYASAFGARNGSRASEGSIEEYAINRSTGALTAIGAFRGANMQQPLGIAAAPDGRFVCVSDAAAGNLLTFAIGPSGRLRLIASMPSLGDRHGKPGLVAIDPSGKSVYTTDYSTGTVVVLRASVDGKLESAKKYRIGISTAGPFAIVLKAIGSTLFVYTGNRGSDTVSSLATRPDMLEAVGESPTGLGDPLGLATDPAGRNLYVVNREAATVARFAIGNTSGATLVPAASMFAVPYPSEGTHPLYIATTPWDTRPSSSAVAGPRAR